MLSFTPVRPIGEVDREDFAKYLHHNALTLFNNGGANGMISCECPIAVYLTYKLGKNISCTQDYYNTQDAQYAFPKWVTDFIKAWDLEYAFQPAAGSAALAILNQLPV